MSERNIVAEKTEMKLPELLAPVGGREQLEAAVNNGADAVYMGGSLFNARMRAENFGSGASRDLKRAIDFAHGRGVKVYITLNTLIKDRELPKAFEYACSLYEMGADAVILQDMGLARLIRKYLSELPMHLSTQGTVYNRSGVEMAAELGFSRVVPARECSLKELECLCSGPAEIEVFVHGALCMCYSGQCQMSRLLGGESNRSGNRGLCAQPCRLLYRDDSDKPGYFLSPKDICTIDYLPELIQAGVSSLKIEGRLKSAEYVAVVTGVYRKYLDAFARTGECCIMEEDRRRLLQIFNRGGFTSGYLFGNPGEDILSGSSPKNSGIPVGRVTGIRPVKAAKNQRGVKKKGRGLMVGEDGSGSGRWLAEVKLLRNETVSRGDGVEFSGGSLLASGSSRVGNVVTYVEKISDGVLRIGDFKFEGKRRINIGDTVYKVTDRILREEALRGKTTGSISEGGSSDSDPLYGSPSYGGPKTKADMLFLGKTGSPAVLKVFADNKTYEVRSAEPVAKAIKKPADSDRIREQLAKLGDTPFEAGEIDVRVDEDAMIPVSVINGLRRQGADMALSGRLKSPPQVTDEVKAQAIEDISITAAKYAGGLQGPESAHGAAKGLSGEAAGNNPAPVLVPLELFMDGITAERQRALSCEDSGDMSYATDYLTSAALDNTSGNASGNASGNVIPYVLNVSRGNLDDYIKSSFDEIVEAVRERGIALGNLGGIREFQRAGIKVYGDYGLNVYNTQALELFAEANVEVIEWSDENSCRRCNREPKWMESIPLMITEHPIGSRWLLDRKGVKHKVMKWYSGDKYLIF